ncbi:5825_t:CDS:2, partial [Paraglomus occultum]
DIAKGPNSVHEQGLIHRDFHPGQSKSASFKKEEGQIFGVLPYVAPEVLQGQPYTQATHDNLLGLKICQGLRPNIDEIPIPRLLKNLIKRCWDAEPTRRPSTKE